jgi:deoxyribodipyrimidine photo-lyase
MLCIDKLREELHRDGWIPNASRMWLASFWSVHGGGGWREGEDRFFQHLLDGSRAANRLGWQWTAGAQTGRRYFFDRDKVERHAPGWCADCGLRSDCPLDSAIPGVDPEPLAQPVSNLSHISQSMLGRGPASSVATNTPEAVWLTAESLGTEDPAAIAHPDLPLLFVFDHARLHRWQLSRKRLVFLVETLAELALSREVELFIGAPALVLAGRRLAATYAPVPGWRAIADGLDLAQQHPWPWLIQPHIGPVASFSAWKKKIEMPVVCSDQSEFSF